MAAIGPGVPQWQLAVLVRKMARVRMASAAQTLRTLKNLIEDIPNMVIRDEIASQVGTAWGWV
ncbi:hypothetical protein T484DRAFT_1854653 [Baffinella frigidus]|nr:hypothetical protein T484DRAFT_1854653 [Cryptophyta sp. CCMP2293]